MDRAKEIVLRCALALSCMALAPAGAVAQEGEGAALGAHIAATHMYKNGNFKKAAELYHTAYNIDPQPAFLFNAARSEQRLVLLDVAEKHFKQLLELKGLDDATRKRTQMHLQEITAVRKAMAALKPAPPSPSVAGEPQPVPAPPQPLTTGQTPDAATGAAIPDATVTAGGGAWKAPVGWTSIGTGAVLTGVGAWLLVSYLGDQEALDGRRAKVNDQGRVLGISYEKYEQEQQSLWTQQGLGAAAAGVGLAAMGVGAWMLATAPVDATLAIAPAARGATLTWRY